MAKSVMLRLATHVRGNAGRWRSSVDLNYCTLDLPAEDRADLRMTIYTAEPGTPSEDALKLLASWAATAVDAATPAVERS
jgi:hypothetical protein